MRQVIDYIIAIRYILINIFWDDNTGIVNYNKLESLLLITVIERLKPE